MATTNFPVVTGIGAGATGPLIKVTTVDYSSQASLAQNVGLTQLIAELEANSTYLVEYFLQCTAAAAMFSMRIKANFPAGLTYAYGGAGGLTSGSSAMVTQPPANLDQFTIFSANANANEMILVRYDITIKTTTAGNLEFVFLGNNGTTPSLIKAGSAARITKLA